MTMKKRMSKMLIALVLVFGGLIGFNLYKQYKIKEFFKTFKMPPATISTVIAKTQDWQPMIDAVGNFGAVNGVEVNTQQPGLVTNIFFKSGEFVHKGQLLLEIEKSIDEQTLAEAKANFALAEADYKRQLALYKNSATPTSTLDSANSNMLKTQAAVNKIQAVIDQKNIRAPFDGKLGLRNVDVGQFISPGTTNLVTLQSQDPLFLRFYLPEHFLSYLDPGQEIHFQVDNYPNYNFKGTIQALNSKVDTATHNILVQANIANCPRSVTPSDTGITECNSEANQKNNVQTFAFIPGMFANIQVMLPLQKNMLVLPRTAISFSLYGNSVYVVRKVDDPISKQSSLKVFQTFVKTGEERGNEVVVLKGIKPGDEVVNSGQVKLQNGTDVIINNEVQLDLSTNIKSLGQ